MIAHILLGFGSPRMLSIGGIVYLSMGLFFIQPRLGRINIIDMKAKINSRSIRSWYSVPK